MNRNLKLGFLFPFQISSNTVRTLGNLLRLINEQHLNNSRWTAACIKAIKVIHQNCTTGRNMKVKWNACYAIGNFMKNPVMYSSAFEWQVRN